MGLKELIGRNLRQPKGFIGKIIGILMNKGNDSMNRFTLNILDPKKDDHILEIGFGNGKYISEIAQVTQNGFVAGIDYSETMVARARKRNMSLIKQGIIDKEKLEKLDVTKNGFRLFEPEEVVQLVKNAGFNDVQLKSVQNKNLNVNCVIAIK